MTQRQFEHLYILSIHRHGMCADRLATSQAHIRRTFLSPLTQPMSLLVLRHPGWLRSLLLLLKKPHTCRHLIICY